MADKTVLDELQERAGLNGKLAKMLRRVKVLRPKLILKTTLPRDDLGEFWGAVGEMHGWVAAQAPNVDLVIIEDISGQTIIVPMKELLMCHRGELTREEFMRFWKITNRKSKPRRR